MANCCIYMEQNPISISVDIRSDMIVIYSKKSDPEFGQCSGDSTYCIAYLRLFLELERLLSQSCSVSGGSSDRAPKEAVSEGNYSVSAPENMVSKYQFFRCLVGLRKNRTE